MTKTGTLIAQQIAEATDGATKEALIATQSEWDGMLTKVVGAGRATSQKKSLGGIISGSSKVGDKVPVMANSGELLLNKPEQNELYKSLRNSTLSKMLTTSPAPVQSGPSSGPMYVTIQVSGVSGEEVANAIDRKLKQNNFQQSTK